MKNIDAQDLHVVAGGRSKSDQLTQTLTSVQTSIRDLASQKNSSSNDLMLPMIMMMAFNRPQPTVVTSAAPTVAPSGPVINVSTRIGRRW
jgi:hypothetical protein